MSRQIKGSFIVIHDQKLYKSIQFSGNMSPSINGKFAYYLLGFVKNINDLEEAIRYFDKKLYDIIDENEEVLSFIECPEEISFSQDYYVNFNSDYLYIKNLDDKAYTLVSTLGFKEELKPGELQAWCFGDKLTHIKSIMGISPEDMERFGLSCNTDSQDLKYYIYEDKTIQTIIGKAIVLSLKKILKDYDCKAFVFIKPGFKFDIMKSLKWNGIEFTWDGEDYNNFTVKSNRLVNVHALSLMMESCIEHIENIASIGTK